MPCPVGPRNSGQLSARAPAAARLTAAARANRREVMCGWLAAGWVRSALDPDDRLGLDGVGGAAAGGLPAAARQSADGADGHVVVAENLAGEADAGEAAGGEGALLGLGHLVRLA